MIWQTVYHSSNGCVVWCGKKPQDIEELTSFIQGPVASRLNDEESKEDLTRCLNGLSLTDMGEVALKDVLEAEVPEARPWAIGEALAEVMLEEEYGVVFPWNMERDKRNPFASLPGADIVGLQQKEDNVYLVFGEVKTSSDTQSPPQVMYGRSGMIHQIDNLANNLSTILQLVKWIFIRVKNTEYEENFRSAMTLYLNSGKQAISLFGVLIRDQDAQESDLRSRAESLATSLGTPTLCSLIAIYLPWSIDRLPEFVDQGRAV